MPERPELAYTVATVKSVPEAVEAVKGASTANGFKVQAVHDVRSSLAQKGFESEELTKDVDLGEVAAQMDKVIVDIMDQAAI